MDEIHIAIPAVGEYRKWAEVCAASAINGSSLPVKVHYIDWSVIDRARLEALGSWHGSAIAFSRLYLAELFPDLDWIVTCDADVLFRGDIAELWALRDDAVSFIAHRDCPLPPRQYTPEQHDWYEAHGYRIRDWNRYFADGLGLVNLKRWREKGYQAEFERLAKAHDDWPSPDMMILNYVLQDDSKLLPVEWDAFSGDENADVDWSKSGAVHFVEDTPWRRTKITHLASDLVEEWWSVAERCGVSGKGYHGCRNRLDWAWRRLAFLFFKRNQWILRLNRRLWLHLRSTRGVSSSPAVRRVGAKTLHVVPGLWEHGNGIAVAARLIAAEQGADMVDAEDFAAGRGDPARYAEVWVHSCWMPQTLRSCRRVLKSGVPLVRMTHANLDPVRLAYHGLRKRLAGVFEKPLLRRSSRIVATCEAEREWIEKYLCGRCPPVEVVDLKRFFNLKRDGRIELPASRMLRLLYLGRRHPLKGVELLEEAVAGLQDVELRVETSLAGEEKERAWEWCDVLVLPTLSENFGLVVAEALERGKRVVTTDGAPAWRGVEGVEVIEGFLSASHDERVALLRRSDTLSRSRVTVCDA